MATAPSLVYCSVVPRRAVLRRQRYRIGKPSLRGGAALRRVDDHVDRPSLMRSTTKSARRRLLRETRTAWASISIAAQDRCRSEVARILKPISLHTGSPAGRSSQSVSAIEMKDGARRRRRSSAELALANAVKCGRAHDLTGRRISGPKGQCRRFRKRCGKQRTGGRLPLRRRSAVVGSRASRNRQHPGAAAEEARRRAT